MKNYHFIGLCNYVKCNSFKSKWCSRMIFFLKKAMLKYVSFCIFIIFLIEERYKVNWYRQDIEIKDKEMILS